MTKVTKKTRYTLVPFKEEDVKAAIEEGKGNSDLKSMCFQHTFSIEQIDRCMEKGLYLEYLLWQENITEEQREEIELRLAVLDEKDGFKKFDLSVRMEIETIEIDEHSK